MAIIDKVREHLHRELEPRLQEGEKVQQVFMGLGMNPWLLGGLLGFLFRPPRVFAVTDRNIVVFAVARGSLVKTKLGDELGRFPRAPGLGEPSGINHKVEIGGERAWIHRIYFGEVRAAEESLRSSE